MKVRFEIAGSSLGFVLVARNNYGVCTVLLGDSEEELLAEMQRLWPEAVRQSDWDINDSLYQIIKWLDHSGQANLESIRISFTELTTDFQLKVWSALRDLKPGQTISYKSLARRIGKPKAFRAVARACAQNKLAILVPCHRVIASDGKLSGYRWGSERKRRLLLTEGIKI